MFVFFECVCVCVSVLNTSLWGRSQRCLSELFLWVEFCDGFVMPGPFTRLLLAACLHREQSFVELQGTFVYLHHATRPSCRILQARRCPHRICGRGARGVEGEQAHAPFSNPSFLICSHKTSIDSCFRLTSVKTQLPYGYYTLEA